MTIMNKMNLMPVKEAAKAANVSEALLRKLVREGRVPFYRLSARSLRFDLEELRGFMRMSAEPKSGESEGRGGE